MSERAFARLASTAGGSRVRNCGEAFPLVPLDVLHVDLQNIHVEEDHRKISLEINIKAHFRAVQSTAERITAGHICTITPAH